MSDPVDQRRAKGNARYCVCNHPGCGKSVDRDGHGMNIFAHDRARLEKVLDILVLNDKELRDQVLKAPKSYRVHTSHFKEEDKRMVTVGQSKRNFSTQDACLVTLVKLRTGMTTRVINAWTGIKVASLTRIFPTWISYLNTFFNAEFPVPTTDQMRDRVGPEWKEILQRGDYKGFDQCAPLLHAIGCQMIAPARRWQNVPHYTADEREGNGEKSNLRIHVERHFCRRPLCSIVNDSGSDALGESEAAEV
eukprot:jgi/Tetstr1/432153/TSEL_021610.t1